MLLSQPKSGAVNAKAKITLSFMISIKAGKYFE